MRKFGWALVSAMVLISASTTYGYTKTASENSLIVPGKSVGKIAIGMPGSNVRKLLGKPTLDHDDYLEFHKKGISVLLNKGKVTEIVFHSKKFATKDGLSLANYDADNRYKKFEHSKLPWRFMNLKHDLKSGGFDIFATNIDSGDPEYEPSVYGVVFAGAKPEAGLQLYDEENGGWMKWDGNSETLWEDAELKDGLFTPKVQSSGAVGKEVR